MEISPRDRKLGVIFALLAFVIWGGVPIYFKAVGPAGPFEILCHRIFWSMPFTALLLYAMHGWGDLRLALKNRRIIAVLMLTACLVALNWLVFIYAVNTGRVLAASMGYFINPLVNVLMGMIFLKERLRPRQILAVLLAAAGTINLGVSYGSLPWISLVLPLSFGFYGLIRKTIKIDSIGGLFVETCLLTPVAIGYFIYLTTRGEFDFISGGLKMTVLLSFAGVVTSVPLVLFTAGVRRITLTTLGITQYLTPSLHFLLAVVVYREPFTTTDLVTFGLIWTGLAVFVADSFKHHPPAVRPSSTN